MVVIYALIFLATPAVLLYLAHHHAWAKKLGVILLCYTAGLLLGNFGLVPQSALGVQQFLSEITVALALPMLLFTLDIRSWSKMAGTAIISMLFATTSVVTLATVLFYVFRGDGLENSSQMAAMAVGVYTGGTPNLAAIKTALEIPHEQYIMFHSLDTLLGGLYILFMLTVGIPLFRYILGKPEASNSHDEGSHSQFDEEDYGPFFRKENMSQLMKIVLLSSVVLGASLGLSALAQIVFSLKSTSALTIVLLTMTGMGLSFSSRIRQLALSYKTGMYFIYVFCFSVASMANLEQLSGIGFNVTVFVVGTIVGSLGLHALLCKLAGVDSDTFMVTSISAICSPPFVPLLVKSLGNPGLLLSGMTTGIIGYALGNFLGISLALFLQS